MRRLLQRFYYLTETLLIRSAGYQLLLVALVIALLSVVGGMVVHLTKTGTSGEASEAVWWAFLRLTDPGYLGDDHGLIPRLVSTFLTISGYVLFLGALVAIMTNWLDRLMAFLASGRSPIFERGHILVIGWSEHMHALVEDLVHTYHRGVDKDGVPAIAILCDPFHPSMHRELSQKLDPIVRKRCRLLLRSGNPLQAESLERVDFQHARSIVLVSQARGERKRGQLSDVTLAKILMTLKSRRPDLKSPPNVVVEVSNPSNKLLLESVGWEESTEAVVGDEILGRLFCQAVRFPGVSKIYRRLLTDSYGHSVSLIPARLCGAVGRPLRDLVGEMPEGTPIGCLPHGVAQSELRLLDLERPVAEEDQLVLIASTAKRKLAEATPHSVSFSPWCSSSNSRPLGEILCIGWSTLLQPFLLETAVYAQETFEVTLFWEGEMPRERERLQRLQESYPQLRLTFVQGSLAEHDEVQRFRPERFSTVMLFSDRRQEPLHSDAETVLRFVLLERYFQNLGHEVAFVVELNDEDNRPLITCPEADVIISSEITSHLLAQVAIHRSLAWIYEDLFTKGGSELRLRSLSSIGVEPGQVVGFEDCQRVCLENQTVAIGVQRSGQVILNPDPQERVSQGDQLVVVEAE